MNSYVRISNVVERRKTDVLPVGPYMGNHCAAVAGVKLIDYYTKPEKMAGVQMDAWEIYGQDILCIQSDNYYIAEGFGVKTNFYENSTPTLREPIVKELKDVSRLKLPDPQKDGRMSVYIEAMDIVSSKFKRKVALRSAGTGPFALAGHLMGVQEFLTEIAMLEVSPGESDEKALHYMLEICTEALIEFSKAQLKAGTDIVQCGDSLASLDMISPNIYEKYVFPYEKRYFDTINPLASKHGAYTILHICGDNTKVMELQAKTGTNIIEVDYKADLKRWKEKIGEKVILIGNLDPSRVLLQGTVEDVRVAALQCIEAAAEGGGFILGSGCEVPIHAPVENIREMIKVAREYCYNEYVTEE